MEALLSSLDLDVALARSGEEALRALLQRDFALVLMDVQMPGLDGFRTTELIRQRNRTRHTPIIFVTAIFTDGASEKRAYGLGAVDFITKPFDESILKAKVAALVEHERALCVIEEHARALRAKQRDADRANAALQIAEAENRTKDDFLAMLSHELRAPLNLVLGGASLLERDPRLPSPLMKTARTIARAARAQSKIIDELLDVSAIVAGTLTIEEALVDVQAVVQSALASMYPAASQKNISLDFSVSSGTFLARGDAKRLEQLISQLLSNAIKFSAAGDAVGIGLIRANGDIGLRVTDAGVGIKAEVLPHIFERFRQADSTRTRRRGGLGLGLTVARSIAHSHGGTLEGFSGGLGAGAEFVLTLPAAAEDTAAVLRDPFRDDVPAVPLDSQPLAGRRLLVVDDDEDTREILSEMLHMGGAFVVTAASSAEAVAAFETGTFDVLVSDIGMPDEDGLTMLRRIKSVDAARGGALIAIAISGYGTADDRAASHRAGFLAHVVKPCDADSLLSLLARLTQSM